MLVLTHLETDKIAHERELRRVLLARPRRARPRRGARRDSASCSACTRSRSRTRSSSSQRPKLDTYDDHVLFVFYTARRCEPERRRSSRSRSTSTSPAASSSPSGAPSAPSSTRCTTSSSTQPTAGRGLHRLPDLRRADRRLLPGHRRCSRSASTRSRARSCSRRPSREQLAEIYRLKQRVHELSRRLVPPARPLHASADAILDARRASPAARASTCATSATTSRRSRASCIVSRTTSSSLTAPTSTPTPTASTPSPRG